MVRAIVFSTASREIIRAPAGRQRGKRTRVTGTKRVTGVLAASPLVAGDGRAVTSKYTLKGIAIHDPFFFVVPPKEAGFLCTGDAAALKTLRLRKHTETWRHWPTKKSDRFFFLACFCSEERGTLSH